ncbi:hypothetical protein PVAND_008399 [Polypedilum vanderplanki]|uniref:C2H2-type domain-containing protein n=1 Tax=Polypedilum vanderplanki TaxID=319348 RepID=A0A9J6C9M3_POLVA|nr:hypothetical protein PVAND_008399 [Polypedilum vanderplanki]
MEAQKYQGSYKCSFCEKIFMRKDKLDRHLFAHTGIKEHICNYEGCDKAYTNAAHLKRHIKTCHLETKSKIYSVICKYPGCLQGFTNAHNMNRHYKAIHENPLPYECNHCEEKFRRKFQLRKHQKIAHDIGKYTYTCEECNEGFFNNNIYHKHVASVHKIKERICNDCNKVLPNWTMFVKHRRVCRNSNTEEKRFICDLCAKQFSIKQNLKIHMNVHMQKQTEVFECHFENCGKFYNAKKNLTAHIRSKHEGKHFMCSICKSKLSTKQKLDLHMEAHSDPDRAQLLKKPKFAVLVGIQMHTKVEDLIDECLPMIRESAESEYSDY